MKVMFYYRSFENLGIEYLSAVLKNAGHQTRLLFDPGLFNDPFIQINLLSKIFDYKHLLIKQAGEFKPDIVAFSATASDYKRALEVAGWIKQHSDARTVFGGAHPSSVPDKVIREKVVDYLIQGEGEFALLELVENLAGNNPIDKINNLWMKKDAKIISNPIRAPIRDLDCLPYPDKDLFYEVIPEYKTGYTLITRRGCPNTCSYCYNSVLKKIYSGQNFFRYRSVDNVIDELSFALKKYHFKRVRVNDDLFTCDEKWLEEFAGKYQAKINLPLFCFASPQSINEAVVRSLKRIRCYQVCMGVQSLNSRLREKILHRYHSNKQTKQAIILLKKNGIRCVVDNIIGLPQETEDDILNMIKFYNNNRPARICVFWLIYFPQTDIVDSALKLGILKKSHMESIENEPRCLANTMYNALHERRKIRYHLLLLLLLFLPKKLVNFIIKKKIYLKLPLIKPALIEAPLTMFTRDRLDIPRRRYYPRYIRFGLQLTGFKTSSFLRNIKSGLIKKQDFNKTVVGIRD